MIIDNKNSYANSQAITTVWDFIRQYTDSTERNGKMDIVTGFFSIAALHVLYTELSKENKYRIILGDIHDMARDEDFLKRAVNLLQGDNDLESTFQLSATAQNAIAFLRQETVQVKTINNTFCHAKAYVYEDKKDPVHDYGMIGSSNLTEAGLGIKPTSNVELNMVETGRENHTVIDLKSWFKQQWENVAKSSIAIPLTNGKTENKNAKEFLIEQIEQVFKCYTPEEIYQKILFELFHTDIEMGESLEYQREMEFLQKSKIWNTLFDFQQSGVISLVKLLTRYGGAVLADAVGLGKTFTALGVIKYFQNNGYHTVIFSPKKLCNNWKKYQYNTQSRFEEDHFDYVVRSHSDLQENRIETNYDDNIKKSSIVSYNRTLIVVDESHNLRNVKSCRYQMLLDDIIRESAKKGHEVKVLLLSATPINTGLLDIRNQFKLIGYGENHHFYNEFDFPLPSEDNDPLRAIFQTANSKYKDWAGEIGHNVNTLHSKLQKVNGFFKLTNELIVARNRSFVANYNKSLVFPAQLKPANKYVEIKNIGSYSNFEEMYDDLDILRLTAYQPTQYTISLNQQFVNRAAEILEFAEKGEEKKLEGEEKKLYDRLILVKDRKKVKELREIIIQNWIVKQTIGGARAQWDADALRELSLSGMMVSLFVKRLESSWNSCLSTLTKVCQLHKEWRESANNYKITPNTQQKQLDEDDAISADDTNEIETKGKRTIDFSKMVRIDDYISNLDKDIVILERLISNLTQYQNEIENQTRKDEKLETLISVLKEKQERKNKKVVIFTTYTDTAQYLYDRIVNEFGNNKVDIVTGDEDNKALEDKLKRFAPYSKIYMDGEWNELFSKKGVDISKFEGKKKELFEKWKELVLISDDEENKTFLNSEFDILVGTDCVSEGQNLQDADMVINYDIHWNPVRLIQRFGRIDRIGSPNNEIGSVNFWPSDTIEEYLNLTERVSNRMVLMNIAGSETLQANENIEAMEQDNKLRVEQNKRCLQELHDNQISDIEELGTPTMATLSLSDFRSEAETYAKDHLKKLQNMPDGAFSGFCWKMDKYANYPECLLALLRHREDAKSFHLLCIPVVSSARCQFKELNKAEVLLLLREHKDEGTYLPNDILNANPETLKALANVIKDWYAPQQQQMVATNIGNMLSGNNDDALQGNEDQTIEQTIDIEKYDLLAWDYVSVKDNR